MATLSTLYPHPYLVDVLVTRGLFLSICQDYPDREAWEAPEPHPTAGQAPGYGRWGGHCAREGCPRRARWIPTGVPTLAYYCEPCAHALTGAKEVAAKEGGAGDSWGR